MASSLGSKTGVFNLGFKDGLQGMHESFDIVKMCGYMYVGIFSEEEHII